MDAVIAWLLRRMRQARAGFTGLYLVVAGGYLLLEPGAGWTWFIVVAGGLLCLLFWALMAFLGRILDRDGADGTGNG